MAVTHNIITSGFSKYVNFLINGHQSTIYFAIGRGQAGWDNSGAPAVSSNISALYDEVFRMPVTEINYVDPDTLEVSNSPTTMVRLKANFEDNQYYGVVREYGLFAINATSALRSGTLINYCNHPKITIPSDVKFYKYIYIKT